MRLAWFTPWPPQSSGVAGRSAATVPLLARRGYGIDVFVDEQHVTVDRAASETPPSPGDVRVQSAHDFVWRALRSPYDLVVYQIGNSRQHAFTWPYLFHWPGLIVLHDARLHHARGQALLSRHLTGRYREEFTASHPDVSPDAAELAIAGFDGAYYYLWPMTRAVARTARAVAAHTRGGAAQVQEEEPDRPVDYIALSSGRDAMPSDDERQATRSSLGYGPDHVVFGLFGGLTPEKRVAEILRAFRRTQARIPSSRLLLAGVPADGVDVRSLITTLGLGATVAVHTSFDDEEFERAIGAVDATLNLRWPTAIETSGPWLQALAAGRATVVTDLVHLAHVPALDPRSWRSCQADDPRAPVAIAIDLLDEDHSLALAMERLAADAALRNALGRAARTYWEREHSMDRMLADYDRVLRRAIASPIPPPMPWASDRTSRPWHELLAPFGDVACELF